MPDSPLDGIRGPFGPKPRGGIFLPFIPSGSDGLITADSLVFKSKLEVTESGWGIVETEVLVAPSAPSPTTPYISGGVLNGPAGIYRVVNADQGTDAEYDLVPPASLSTYGEPGEALTVYHLTFSSAGPTVSFPDTTPVFPTFRSLGVVTQNGTASTSAAVTIDATRQAGDTMFVAFVADGSPAYSGYLGWTLIREDQAGGSGTSQKTILLKRTATADASDNLTIALSASETYCAKAWCGIGAQEIVVSTNPQSSSGIGQSANAPSLTLAAEKYARWLALVSQSGSNAAVSAGAAPTNYTYEGSLAASGSGSSTQVRLHAAYRELIATTEDPGSFAQTIDGPTTYTVAIYNGV